MCGIAGYVVGRSGHLAQYQVVEAMCQTLVHRGPDDQGVYADGPAGLGIRRLSVIDLNTGHQPISNENGTVWVVFNGEIYDYRELVKQLLDRGHRLTTSSDTEVIVHLYEEYGADCVQHLRGMFAFALWDRETSRLLLARDRLGVKPLYYAWDGDRLIFGSELKAVLAHPAIRPVLDAEGLLYYLRYSYIPDPLTIFQGIKKLPPGHSLILQNGSLSVKPYWDGCLPHDLKPHSLSEEEALKNLDDILREAVRLRLISDVPLGAFLSGGIDSSLVVALMARELSMPVSTFSIGFEEEPYNELPYAREVADHLGTDHHELMIGPQACDLIERIVVQFDEPFGDPSAIPTYYLSKLASDFVTVALSGDGGDEMFAGYDRYKVDLQRRRVEALPAPVRAAIRVASRILPAGFPGKNLMRNVSLTGPQRYLENVSYLIPPLLDKLLSMDYQEELERTGHAASIMEQYYKPVEGRDWLAQLQYFDTKTYLPGDVLTKVDRMSMAHSLEVRSPFLDHVLVEFVAGLPSSLKLRAGVSKYLLKQLALKYLPAPIVQRKKQGFGVPLEYWFKKDLREFVHDTLLSPRTLSRNIFQPAVLTDLVGRYERGDRELAPVIWNLLILENWCRLYLDQRSLPEGAPDRTASLTT